MADYPTKSGANDANAIFSAIEMAKNAIYQESLANLGDYSPAKMDERLLAETPGRCLLVFRLNQFTHKRGEDMRQKLSTVYHAAMAQGCSLFVMVEVPSENAPAEFYLGVRAPDTLGEKQARALGVSFSALKEGIESHFPGSETEIISASQKLPKLLDSIFDAENADKDEEKVRFVSSVSCVASLRDKNRTEQKDFVQGLEKLVDAMRGKTYTAVLIAEPVTEEEQREIRAGYENLYSVLSALRKSVLSYQENRSYAETDTLSRSVTKSVTDSVTKTESHTTTRTNGRGTGQSLSAYTGINFIVSVGMSVGVSWNQFKSESDSSGEAEAKGRSESNGETDTASRSVQETRGSGQTLQIELTNKTIEEMLGRIEEQLKRIREGEDYGAYSCGAYFLSSRQENCLLAANTYRALMLGDGSSVERGAVNTWRDPAKVTGIKAYLRRFAHPVLMIPASASADGKPRPIMPDTIVSGLELPLHLGLPVRSVMGLPVIEHAEFGRNVMSGDSVSVPLGKLYHMGREENGVVRLDRKSLAAHTFVTGSTGAGKTNTVCTLLRRVCLEPTEEDATDGAKRPTFLVVEPAKGEYKNFLGNRRDVYVYGTNPKKTPLLRLNPFSFPEDTHVLEHIDRLVEIFNACWPMYAAMPAVLKDAIESAYRNCGWSLIRSERLPSGRFPCFADLLKALPEVMRSSDYSADTRNDYTGALVTRVKSLTNGINGRIFCAQGELSDAELFDRNVIVDLSRVGSMETKSLLMGILTMKLLEYRMAQGVGNEENLKHITVLEEAHNLLRRTSAEQSQESSNLQGKSVEMLSASIAEMRSYGEGFIIADQAPGLLDMAVIRNTNTKIIHRLPDESDRILVGKAAGLDDGQITELYRLEQGVAAVFQNHWQEPVLCKVERLPDSWKGVYDWKSKITSGFHANDALFCRVLHGARDGVELSEEQIDRFALWIDRLDTGRAAKELLHSVLRGEELDDTKRRWLSYCLLRGRTLIENAEKQSPEEARAMADSQAMDSLEISPELAAEARRLAFLYAAEKVRQDEVRYRELLFYGGVR